MDWEEMILARQESEADDCRDCPYIGEACENQCGLMEEITNPMIERELKYDHR